MIDPIVAEARVPGDEGTRAQRSSMFRHQQPYVSVIVPVWNGADRLPATLFALHQLLADQGYPAELIVVDDCSGPETVRAIRTFCAAVEEKETRVRVLRNEQNRGKGFSVARGMLAAQGALRVFTDADLAYPAGDIEGIIDALEKGHDVAVACRVLRESRYIMSPTFFPYLFTRHVMSRAYNAFVRRLLVSTVLDTQAGLKGFTRAAAEVIFPRLTIPRFGFDVECLYIAQRHGHRLAQVPVTFRYDDEPSTVNFVRDSARMLTDIGRIIVNAWRGRYD
jgi:dolichyl-phosphate beta-glucosyltransferase